MTFAFIASTRINNSVSGGTSSAINTTGSNILVAEVSWYYAASTTSSLSDSKGNTWMPLTKRISADNNYATQHYYCINPTVGTGHTFTCSMTNCYPVATIMGFSNSGTITFDKEGGGNNGSNTTSVQPGNITPTSSNSLIITSTASNNNSGLGVDSGFTAVVSNWTGNSITGGEAYLIQGAAAAVNPTWSWTTGSQASAAISVFKSTGGAIPLPLLTEMAI